MESKKSNKDILHDWVFHYNMYPQKWDATTRENYTALFSNRSSGIISSSEIQTLIDLIVKSKGNLNIEKGFVIFK